MTSKNVLGIILIFVGIVLGLYFGIWWAFIGGIVGVIEEIRAEHLNAMNVAFNIAKVCFSGLIGSLVSYLFIIPGWFLIEN